MGKLIVVLLLVTAAYSLAQSIFITVKEADLASIRIAVSLESNINRTDEYGQTPLMYAAGINQDPEVISALVEAGADVNALTLASWTALMYAVRDNPNPEVVQRLLDLGANPLLINSNKQHAIDLATENDAFYLTLVYERLLSLSVLPSQPAPQATSDTAPAEGCQPDQEELIADIQAGVAERIAADIDGLDQNVKDVSWQYSNPQLAIEGAKARLTADWQASAEVSGLTVGISGNFSADFAWEPCEWYLLDYTLGN